MTGWICTSLGMLMSRVKSYWNSVIVVLHNLLIGGEGFTMIGLINVGVAA